MEKQHNMLKKPSFWSLVVTGIMILYILIKLIIGRNGKDEEDPMFMIIMILLTVVFGIHGLLHLGLEKVYDYNPIETGKLF